MSAYFLKHHQIINELLVDSGKKVDSPFILNRLEKAVSALEKSNPHEGYFFKTLYLGYINKPKEAIYFISDKINRFGNEQIWLEAKLLVAKMYTDWITYKKVFNEYFSNVPSKNIRTDIVEAYISDSIVYGDSTVDIKYILNSISSDGYELKTDEMRSMLVSFSSYPISLETYRRVLDISHLCIYKKYNVETLFSLRFADCIQVAHSCDLWSVEEAIQLTKEINGAILEVEDIDFQLEADEIEVFCINFSPDNLPEDFSLYDDDNEDQELVKIIESRMQSNPKLEAFAA